MKRQINILTSIDWLSVILYLLMVIFGWMNVFAVNYTAHDPSFFSIANRYTLQLYWILISIIIIFLIFAIDSRFFSFIANPTFAFGIFMLLLVLVFGATVNNSKSWIIIGPIGFQPSEFAKTATALALAKYLSGYNVKLTRMKDICISMVIIFLPALLIMVQPDFGSTIVYGALILVLFREGLTGSLLILIAAVVLLFLMTLILLPIAVIGILVGLAILATLLIQRRALSFLIAFLVFSGSLTLMFILRALEFFPYDNFLILSCAILITSITAVAFAFLRKIKLLWVILMAFYLAVGFTYSVDFLFNNVMKEHQRNRVNVMLGLASDPFGYEYNVRQSKIAIGSGGFSGNGFMQGTQTKFKFVPEQSTDFIFCTVGEEWGFLGSSFLIIVFIGLLVRIIFLAERQRSKFSRIYGYAVASLLFFHFAVNIGMTIGLFPVIGIPLPFISYGGSSQLAFTLMLFIFLKLDSTRTAYMI